MKYPETARRLLKAMADANIKAYELAEKAHLSKGSISHYVNGTHEPGNKSAAAMANVLGVDAMWLMGLDVEIRENPLAEQIKRYQLYQKIQHEAHKAEYEELVRLFKNADKITQRNVMTLLKHSQPEEED